MGAENKERWDHSMISQKYAQVIIIVKSDAFFSDKYI